MNSWSPSGKVVTTRDSSPICVASSVPQSCERVLLDGGDAELLREAFAHVARRA